MNLSKNHILKNRIKVFVILIPILILAGCKNSTEIEDKDFALAVGMDLSYEDLEVIYEFSRTSSQENEEDKSGGNNLFQAEVKEFYEAEKEFHRNSNKTLDYKHLKALIIGKDLLEEEEKLEEYILYIERNSLYPWNTLVFVGEDTAKEVFEESENIDTSLGEYLNKMYANGEWEKTGEMITLRDLIHHYYNEDEILLIPTIGNNKENGGNPIVVGYKLMKNFQYVSKLTLEEMDSLLVGKGKGNKKVFKISINEDLYVVEVNKIRRRVSIKQQKEVPVTYVTLIGEGRIVNKEVSGAVELEDLEKEFNHYLEIMVTKLIINEKEKSNVDILNSFEILGRKNRNLWFKYHKNQDLFEEELQYVIESDLNLL